MNDLFDLVGLDSKRKGSVSSFVSSSSEVSSESKADVISPVPLSIRKSLSNVSRHSRRSSLSKAQLTGFDPEAVMTHQECGGFRAIFPFDRETDRLSRDLLIEVG